MQNNRRRFVQAAVLLLVVGLLAQAGVQMGRSPAPATATTATINSDTPRMASVAGAPASQSSVADAPPFEVGQDAVHDVSPPLRDSIIDCSTSNAWKS